MDNLGTHWVARGVIIAMLQFMALSASATAINYTVTQVAGIQWRYAYTIDSKTLANPITEFTVFFDRNLYSNLSVAASPVDWAALVVQPDLGIPDDGFFDAVALTSGISTSAQLAGFSALFDFLGSGTPSRQPFEIVDVNFNTIESGLTRTSTDISEPETLSLALFGFVLIALFVGRRSEHPFF